MKVWIEGYGEHERNDVSRDWRPLSATLTVERNHYYHSRVFPGYGSRVLNPIDKCSCVKCAEQKKEQET